MDTLNEWVWKLVCPQDVSLWAILQDSKNVLLENEVHYFLLTEIVMPLIYKRQYSLLAQATSLCPSLAHSVPTPLLSLSAKPLLLLRPSALRRNSGWMCSQHPPLKLGTRSRSHLPLPSRGETCFLILCGLRTVAKSPQDTQRQHSETWRAGRGPSAHTCPSQVGAHCGEGVREGCSASSLTQEIPLIFPQSEPAFRDLPVRGRSHRVFCEALHSFIHPLVCATHADCAGHWGYSGEQTGQIPCFHGVSTPIDEKRSQSAEKQIHKRVISNSSPRRGEHQASWCGVNWALLSRRTQPWETPDRAGHGRNSQCRCSEVPCFLENKA